MNNTGQRYNQDDIFEGIFNRRNYLKNHNGDFHVQPWSNVSVASWSTQTGPSGAVTIGGVTNLTPSRTTTNPLVGAGSIQLLHNASNAQGQGLISDVFTLDRKDLGRILTYSFAYEVVAGNSNFIADGLATQSMEVWVYDVTAGAWIQPSGYRGMNQNTLPGRISGEFQASVVSGQQYRLALFVNTNATLTYTVNFDDFFFGYQYVPTGIVPKAPTTQRLTAASGTYTTPAGVQWIRVRMVGGGGGGSGSSNSAGNAPDNGTNGGSTTFGSSLLIATGGVRAVPTGGEHAGGAGGTPTVNSPAIEDGSFAGADGMGSSVVIATATAERLPGGFGGGTPFSGASGSTAQAGNVIAVPFSGAGGGGGGIAGSTDVRTGAGGGGGGYVQAIIMNPAGTYPFTVGAGGTGGSSGTSGASGRNGAQGVIIVEEFYYGSNTQMSADSSSMPVAGSFGANTATSIPNNTVTKVNFAKVQVDSLNQYNTSTSTYTIPVTGDYEIGAKVEDINLATGAGTRQVYIYRNGVQERTVWRVDFSTGTERVPECASPAIIHCNAGDQIDIRVLQISGGSLTLNSGVTDRSSTFYWFIKKIGSNTPLAASERSVASYSGNAGDSLTATGILKFVTKERDDLNQYNPSTGVFTCKIPGEYLISATLFSISATTAWTPTIRRNGVVLIRGNPQPVYSGGTSNINNQSNCQLTWTIHLNAGDTCDIFNSVAIAVGTIYNSGIDNYLSIQKVG